eukprot:SAG22_NODE_665_length_8020_cov_22.612296_3_plen_48_part_00
MNCQKSLADYWAKTAKEQEVKYLAEQVKVLEQIKVMEHRPIQSTVRN